MNYFQENNEAPIYIGSSTSPSLIFAPLPFKNEAGISDFTLAQAENICSKLPPVEGRSWRVPTKLEMINLYHCFVSPKKHPDLKKHYNNFLSSLPSNLWTSSILNEHEAMVIYTYGSPETGKAYIDELAGVWPVCS